MLKCSVEVGEPFSSFVILGVDILVCSSIWAGLERDVGVEEGLALRSAELVAQSSLVLRDAKIWIDMADSAVLAVNSPGIRD